MSQESKGKLFIAISTELRELLKDDGEYTLMKSTKESI